MTQRPASKTDRRNDSRQRFIASLRMTVLDTQIEGVSDNFSTAGLLFKSEDTLRVQIEFDTEDGPQVRQGRLVRAERMSANNTGFAIELDPQDGE